MTDADARLLAQDDVDACNADGSINPLRLAALLLGGIVFFLLFGIWMVTNWILGEFT